MQTRFGETTLVGILHVPRPGCRKDATLDDEARSLLNRYLKMVNDGLICLRYPDNGPNRQTNCSNHGRLSSRDIGNSVSEPMLIMHSCISNTI